MAPLSSSANRVDLEDRHGLAARGQGQRLDLPGHQATTAPMGMLP